MLGNVKEYIIESSEAGTDIYNDIGEGRTISAIEFKADKDCTIKVNGSSFEVSAGEVLSFPYNYMQIKSISVETAGIRVKIRYLIE